MYSRISIIGDSGSDKSTLTDIIYKELKYVCSYNKKNRPTVLNMLKTIPHNKVLIFKKAKRFK